VLREGRIGGSFRIPALRLTVIGEADLFGRKVARKKWRPVREGYFLRSFGDLKEGDFVVHTDHGIGLYRGLQKLAIDRIENDFLLLEYLDGDRLYIPVDRLDQIQRYIGSDGHAPKVDKLGGLSWEAVKEKVRKSVREVAEELVGIYAAREVMERDAFAPPDRLYDEFSASFEFEETPDQARAIDAHDPGIILDTIGIVNLAARDHPFQHERSEPGPGGIESGPQTGGARPHDNDIIRRIDHRTVSYAGQIVHLRMPDSRGDSSPPCEIHHPKSASAQVRLHLSLEIALEVGRDTGDLVHQLAVLEHEHRRDAHDPVAAGDLAILIHVHLADPQAPLIFAGHLLEDRGRQAAGTAPGGPEIHQHGEIRSEHFGLKGIVGHFQRLPFCHRRSP
jgi:hypothetical protein